jgi:putative transposase
MDDLWLLVGWLRALLRSRTALVVENLALRQQLVVLRRSVRRPRLRRRDRVFWIGLSQFWGGWRGAIILVQPATVVTWHRQGFRLYWRWKSRGGKLGRPTVEREIRDLVRCMSRENPLWGAPRIQAELQLLGLDAAESTVAKYMARTNKPPSPNWRTFLNNHMADLAAIDFFVVPTATFRLLYCFMVLSLDRRRVVHFNVTANPSAAWTAQQIMEAFPYDSAPCYLTRDQDGIYGNAFQSRIKTLGIEEVVSAPRSPWQNPYVERLIGSIRRECLNHVIVINEGHLKRILTVYFEYYHRSRTHLSLDRNAPVPREPEPPERGPVRGIPQVGGLHHRYTRVAA